MPSNEDEFGFGTAEEESPKATKPQRKGSMTADAKSQRMRTISDPKMSKLGEENLPTWCIDAMASGKKKNLYKASGNIGKGKDQVIPVLHKFMSKHITEDPDNGQMMLVGTMIQQVCGITHDAQQAAIDADFGLDEPDAFKGEFDFRFNEISARKEQVEMRRRVPIPEFGERSTYNCLIPMEKQVIFGLPPYEIVELKVLIELSTGSHTYTDEKEKRFTCQVRPNILVNAYDERELFYVKKKDAFDKCDTMNIITTVPRVHVHYDTEKKYCPKYEVTFYAETPMYFKFITTICPLLLVTFVQMLNVLDPAGDQHGPALENSIANALTVVFVLPALTPTGTDMVHRHGFGLNELWIGLIYLGLFLSSVRLDHDHAWLADPSQEPNAEYEGSGVYDALVALVEGDPGNREGTLTRVDRVGYLGIFFMLLSFAIPLWNLFQYKRLKNHLKDGGEYDANSMKAKVAALTENPEHQIHKGDKNTEKREAFLMNKKNFNRWEVFDEDDQTLQTAELTTFMMDIADMNKREVGNAWDVDAKKEGNIFLSRGPEYAKFMHEDSKK